MIPTKIRGIERKGVVYLCAEDLKQVIQQHNDDVINSISGEGTAENVIINAYGLAHHQIIELLELYSKRGFYN